MRLLKTLKSFVLSILVLIIVSCNNKITKSEFKKEERIFNASGLVWEEYVEIDLDSLLNYGDLFEEINKITCEKSITLKFENDSIIYRVKPFDICPTSDYRLRQVIYVNPDSIFVNDSLKFPIDNLNQELRKHLINKKNDINYPQKEEMRFVSIYMDSSENLNETKNLITEIISSFDELKKDNDLIFSGIALRERGMIRIVEKK